MCFLPQWQFLPVICYQWWSDELFDGFQMFHLGYNRNG